MGLVSFPVHAKWQGPLPDPVGVLEKIRSRFHALVPSNQWEALSTQGCVLFDLTNSSTLGIGNEKPSYAFWNWNSQCIRKYLEIIHKENLPGFLKILNVSPQDFDSWKSSTWDQISKSQQRQLIGSILVFALPEGILSEFGTDISKKTEQEILPRLESLGKLKAIQVINQIFVLVFSMDEFLLD